MDAEFHLIPTLLLGDWRKAQIALRRSSFKYVLCQLVKFVHEGGCTREVLYLPSSAVVAEAEQHPNPMENIAVVLKKFNTVFKKGIPGLGDEDALYRLGFDKVIEILDSCVVLFELDEPKDEIKYQCSCYDFWYYYRCKGKRHRALVNLSTQRASSDCPQIFSNADAHYLGLCRKSRKRS